MDIDKLSSDQLVSLIKISKFSERYNDMTKYLSKLVKQRCKYSQELSSEERDLLSLSYKTVISNIRSSLRSINQINHNQSTSSLINKKYKLYIEKELEIKCLEILNLLNNYLLLQYNDNNYISDNIDNCESYIIYLKMCGDYYRYLCEIDIDDIDDIDNNEEKENNKYSINAEKFYSDSLMIAKLKLSETNPIRLGISLNFSVCLYEILNKQNEACVLAKEAFNDAIQKLDTLSTNKEYKETCSLLSVIRDNLNVWSEETQ